MENKDTCKGCEHETDNSGYCLDCSSGDRYISRDKSDKEKKNIRYDLIRNMSVDELADFLNRGIDNMCFDNCLKSTGDKFKCPFGEEITPDNCKQCIKRWLESEVTK